MLFYNYQNRTGVLFNLKKEDDKDTATKKNPYISLLSFENRERDGLPATTPGSIYKVDIDNTHPLMYGYPNYYYTLKMDTNVYDFIKENGWNAGVIKKDNQVAGFVGYKLKDKLKDGCFLVCRIWAGAVFLIYPTMCCSGIFGKMVN